MDMDKILALEDENGYRFSFNTWPNNKVDVVSASCPIGALYTPLKELPSNEIPRDPLPYDPVSCTICQAYLNSYARIDFINKTWSCPVCSQRNPLPAAYHGITPEMIPLELHEKATTVEFVNSQYPTRPPIFIFLVDTCIQEKELEHLKSNLMEAVTRLPQNSLVGFITFGSFVRIHELIDVPYPRHYMFSGNKTYTQQELLSNINVERMQGGEFRTNVIIPLKDAQNVLFNLVDKLEYDRIPTPKDERILRCTGAAMSIAETLLEAIFPQIGGQIFIFTSGPITKGPGLMAPRKRGEPVRQHADIAKGKAESTKVARIFFDEIGKNATSKHIAINYISACFEEAGLYEIEPAILATGGWLISAESWADANISESLKKYFEKIIKNTASDIVTSVILPPNVKVCGCIGPCMSIDAKGQTVSDKVIGIGGTSKWSMCQCLPSTTLAFYFDVNSSKANPITPGTTSYIQFVTSYRHFESGQYRRRVTTAKIDFADMSSSKQVIANSFDQECATVLLARYALWRCRTEALTDVVHYIDRTLIRFCRVFGIYTPGEPNTFTFGQTFQFLPQFLYHFRRSSFMSTFNTSPDLTASLRHSLLMEDTANSLFMIQPSLVQFTTEMTSRPVFLDMSSLDPKTVLLLDTYFRVLVWTGSDVVAWRNQGLHVDDQYSNIAWMMDQPLEEAKLLANDRFPTPLFITCDQDSSLSRYLLARCNPSNTGFSEQDAPSDEQTLSKFIEKLRNVSVQQ